MGFTSEFNQVFLIFAQNTVRAAYIDLEWVGRSGTVTNYASAHGRTRWLLLPQSLSICHNDNKHKGNQIFKNIFGGFLPPAITRMWLCPAKRETESQTSIELIHKSTLCADEYEAYARKYYA